MYVFANFQMMCLGQPGASREALLALNHTGVIGEMEHPQKYLSEAKDTSGNPRTFVLQSLVASPPHPASLVWLPGRCWNKGHPSREVGQGLQGAAGPCSWSVATQYIEGRGGLCPGVEASHSLAWRIDCSDALLPSPAFSVDRSQSPRKCVLGQLRTLHLPQMWFHSRTGFRSDQPFV